MPFHSRNAYYLRVSASNVIPLYLYLDERHVGWMSDRVLQYILADLRPKIVPKMTAEADIDQGTASSQTKKGTVDVHRGDTYQFAYFFRKTEPHAVLVKARNFVIDTRPPQPPPKPSEENMHTSKRKNRRATREKTSSESRPKNAKRRKTQNRRELSEEDAEAEETPNEDETDTALDAGAAAVLMAPRRSSRARKLAAGSYREDKEDVDMDDESTIEVSNSISDDTRQTQVGASTLLPQTTGAQPPTVMMMKDETEEVALIDPPSESVTSDVRVDDGTTLNAPQPGPEVVIEVEDDEEPKPKLSLQVKYQGFTIYGRCLCVVVEPWPPIRSASRAPSLAPPGATTVRASSIAPSDFIPTGQRAKTPLFLPDFDRETTPTLVSSRQTRILPPVPLFNDPSPEEGYDSDLDADDDNSGLMKFSQVLSATAETNRMVEDDDEFEGAVFFADADQAREL